MPARPAAARRAVAPPAIVQDFPAEPSQDLDVRSVEASEALGRAIDRGAAALERLAEIGEPVAEAVASLSDAQKRFCAFIVGHRLKLTASVPIVLVGVGAISPNAARVIGELLRAWGV